MTYLVNHENSSLEHDRQNSSTYAADHNSDFDPGPLYDRHDEDIGKFMDVRCNQSEE